MKKIVPPIALAFVLLLVVIGCKAQGEHQADVPPEETVKVEETQPVATPEPEATNEPVNQVEQMSVNTQQETDTLRLATEEELLKMFQLSYEFGQIFASTGYSDEDVLEEELFRLNSFIENPDDFRVPDDVEVQYIKWRVLNHSQEPEVTEAPASNPQTDNNQAEPVNTQTGGSGGTSQTSTGTTNTQQGSLVQQPSSGDLAVDVTGGKSPMDFIGNGSETDEEVKNSGAYLDWSKVGFGN